MLAVVLHTGALFSMSPPIIDKATLLAAAIIVLLLTAVILTAVSRARGWHPHVPGWTSGVLAVALLAGLSIWHNRAAEIQIEACAATFDAYMERNDYTGWSRSCSDVMLAAETKAKAPLPALCVANAGALLSGDSSFESRFVFQEGYCRANLTPPQRAEVVAGVAGHCAATRTRLASIAASSDISARQGMAAFGRLCPAGQDDARPAVTAAQGPRS